MATVAPEDLVPGTEYQIRTLETGFLQYADFVEIDDRGRLVFRIDNRTMTFHRRVVEFHSLREVALNDLAVSTPYRIRNWGNNTREVGVFRTRHRVNGLGFEIPVLGMRWFQPENLWVFEIPTISGAPLDHATLVPGTTYRVFNIWSSTIMDGIFRSRAADGSVRFEMPALPEGQFRPEDMYVFEIPTIAGAPRPQRHVRPASNDKLEDRLPADLKPLLEANTCTICLQLFFRPVTLPCGHTFCEECMERIATPVCPVCRAPFDSTTPIRENISILTTCDFIRNKSKPTAGGKRTRRTQRKQSTRNKK